MTAPAGAVFSFMGFVALFCMLVTGLSGCALFGHKVEKTVEGQVGSARGQWRGKALVRDFRNGKSATLDLDILAQEPSRMRLEATGSFGVHVASIALDGKIVRMILTQQKKFIQASADSEALSRLIPIRVTPRTLLGILFDRKLDPDVWACQLDDAKLPRECTSKEGGQKVEWLERKDKTRRLKISAPDSSIEMVLDESVSTVEFNDKAFTLDAPDGYKTEIEKR